MQSARVIPFQFEANKVRTAVIDGQPWFAAKDVICALEYAKSSAPAKLIDHVPTQWKGVNPIHTPGGVQRLLMLSEQGLYFFLGRSDKEKALPFQIWLAGDVLPEIRRTGRYEDTSNKMAILVDALIGMTEVNVIKGLIRDKAKVIPIDRRRGFQLAMHNRLHTRFNVPRVELIPAQQFEAACNFVAAYALEGEWLPKDEPKQTFALSCPIEELTKRRPAMLVEKAGERTWLDVTLHDLRDIRGMPTPCEAILYELQKHGFDIEGAWWELRTYRNKLSGLEARIKGLCMELEDPHRYAV